MLWEIRGTKNGKSIRAKVSASSEQSAHAKAESSGVTVTAVLPYNEPGAAPATAASSYAGATAETSPYAAPDERGYSPAPQEYTAAPNYSADVAQGAVAYPAQPIPVANRAPESPSNVAFGLGLASIICGGIGTFLFCFWLVSLPAGLAGLVTGITGWILAKKRQEKRILPMVGTFVSIIPFLIWGAVAIGFAGMLHLANKAHTQQVAEDQASATAAAQVRAAEKAQAEARDKAKAIERAEADAEKARQHDAKEAEKARKREEDKERAQADAEARAAQNRANHPPAPDPNEPPIEIGADDLMKAFAANQVAAEATYRNHWLQVQGTVTQIHKNSIALNGADKQRGVLCNFAPGNAASLLTLQVGLTATLKGRCTGGSLRSITLRDSVIVK